MNKNTILLMLTLLALTNNAQLSSFVNKAKNKAADKTKNTVESKVENAVDNTVAESGKSKKEEKTETEKTNGNSNSKTAEATTKVENLPATSIKAEEEKASDKTISQNSNFKIYFSTDPTFLAKDKEKTVFSSKEFIYAKIELPEDVKTYFKMGALKDKQKHSLEYKIKVFKDDELQKESVGWTTIFVSNAELTQKFLIVDVLPQPEKATTVLSPVKEFNYGLASVPLPTLIDKYTFPSTGKYKISLQIYKEVYGPYDEPLPKEQWPSCESSFDFDFSTDDVLTLQKNGETANAKVKEGFRKKEREDADLPSSWSMQNSSIGSGYTEQQLKAMVSTRYKESKLIRMVVQPVKGGWVVEKNDIGIPTGKYFDQIISIFIKDSKGSCYYIEGYVYQTYEGGGKYGNSWMYPEKEVQVSCNKMETK